MNIANIYINKYIKEFASQQIRSFILKKNLSFKEFVDLSKTNQATINRILHGMINDHKVLTKLMITINTNVKEKVFNIN